MNFQQTLLVGLVTALPFTASLRAAESVQDAFRRGLLAEETTRDLKAAAEAYSEAVRLSADQRAIEATALFRLAECQKKLGNATEATSTLQRLVREYPEQRELLAKIPANPDSKRPVQAIDLGVLARLKTQLEAAMLQEQATEGATPLAPPAGSMTGRATTGRNPGVITSLSEADLRAQVDSLSAELEVLQRLPDAADRGRFLVSRHPELTTDNFRGEVGSWSAIPKSSRTNDSWLHFESQVRNLIRPLEDRLQFARMELEVLQKQREDREPIMVTFYGAMNGSVSFRPSQHTTLSDAVLQLGHFENADLRKVKLHRRGATGGEDLLTVDVERILKTGDRKGDIELRNADRIEVREKGLF